MSESYKISMSQHLISFGRTEEDDPERSRYIDRLLRDKQRTKSNWAEVLAKPMRHQRWLKQPDARP